MAILALRKFFSDYKKTGETVPYFSSKSMASRTSFSFTYQVCSSQMQQNIIKHLDSFMEALLSDKDPCHYISAAVMMNLISRLRLSFFVEGTVVSFICSPCLCLQSCNNFPACQPAFRSTAQTSGPSQNEEGLNSQLNK